MKTGLPELVFLKSDGITGGELILQTSPPYYLGRVYRFESDKSEVEFLEKHRLEKQLFCLKEYRMVISCVGELNNYYESPVANGNLSAAELNFIRQSLKFYEKERVTGNETRIKKYKR